MYDEHAGHIMLLVQDQKQIKNKLNGKDEFLGEKNILHPLF